MDKGPIVFILAFITLFCFSLLSVLPSKYTKLEESFEGFMKKNLVRLEFEKSPLHTIVCGATGTGKTCCWFKCWTILEVVSGSGTR